MNNQVSSAMGSVVLPNIPTAMASESRPPTKEEKETEELYALANSACGKRAGTTTPRPWGRASQYRRRY